MMKKHLLTFAVIFISLFSTQAQTRKENYEKIRAFKISFIAEKLNLTEQEADKFWPLYTTYDRKMISLHKEERYGIKHKIQRLGGIDNLTEEESKDIIYKIKSVSKEQYETKNNFYSQLATFLPYKKILMLEVAEHEFRKKLIKKLRGKKKP
ncbi:hypothetical protein P8625_01690 [Tenacibaculum tangerinum]|uniref:Sensor of ECF-type sigma factor n=1 Tax=Tenacibaculum tangerinum TaxID=3038772 RepID=A0ABY8L6A6_9FLAO|nr:hypothetical protein [Tenacibaculum tangerinum]WGH75903.1 hypothetical protein P8625_01690 [Tenacibaculum tangerinum]